MYISHLNLNTVFSCPRFHNVFIAVRRDKKLLYNPLNPCKFCLNMFFLMWFCVCATSGDDWEFCMVKYSSLLWRMSQDYASPGSPFKRRGEGRALGRILGSQTPLGSFSEMATNHHCFHLATIIS